MSINKLVRQIAKKWYIILITILVAVFVTAIFKGIFVKKEYESSATCYVTDIYDAENGKSLTENMLNNFLNLSKTSSILSAVAEDASIKMLGYSTEELTRSLQIFRQANLITINCKMNDPIDSQLIAQAYLNAGLPKVKSFLTDNVKDFEYTVVSAPEEGKVLDSGTLSIYILAILFGGIVGAFLALLPMIKGNVAYEYSEIPALFGANLLAVMPNKDVKQKSKHSLNFSEILTEYDSAVGALVNAIQSNNCKTAMIVPCEKRTDISDIMIRYGNLSAQNHSTVVVDADLRQQYLTKQCKIEQDGLSEYILGMTAKDNLEVKDNNFTIVPTGKDCAKAVPLFLAGQANQLLEELQQKYDNVILVTPSIDEHRDALSFGKHAQGAVLVIDATSKNKVVSSAIQKFEQSQIKLLGIVMVNYPK